MLIMGATDTVTLVSSSTSALDVTTAFVDYDGISVTTPGKSNAAITTATTTTIITAPGSGTRNVKMISVRNKGAAAQLVTVSLVSGGTTYELVSWTVNPQETLLFIGGVGWTKQSNLGALRNASTADQAITAATDTIITGTVLSMSGVQAGTVIKSRILATKTAASTAAAVFNVRFGTAGTTADTARLTFTLGAQTAAADTGIFDLRLTVRGPIGASCIVEGALTVHHHTGTTTGFVNLATPVYEVASTGFDITPAGTLMSVSVNTGASAAWTLKNVVSERILP